MGPRSTGLDRADALLVDGEERRAVAVLAVPAPGCGHPHPILLGATVHIRATRRTSPPCSRLRRAGGLLLKIHATESSRGEGPKGRGKGQARESERNPGGRRRGSREWNGLDAC